MSEELRQIKKEIEIAEKCTPIHKKNNELEGEKTNRAELEDSKCEIPIVKRERSIDEQISVKANEKNKFSKRKLTDDGVTTERVLSEGEASSGFETVSSADSKNDFEEIELSSFSSDDDYNVIVRIENDLANQKKRKSNERCYWRDQSSSKIQRKKRKSESERLLDKYTNPKRSSFRNYKQSKHWQKKNGSTHYRCNEIDKWKRENDDRRHSRRRRSLDRIRSRCSDHSMSSTKCRYSEGRKRCRRSASRDDSERSYRILNSKSSTCKAKQTESKHSRNYEKSKSNMSRNCPSTEQTYSKSSSTSVWERLDGGEILKETKENPADKSCRPLGTGQIRITKRKLLLVDKPILELNKKPRDSESPKSVVDKADFSEKDQNETPATTSDVPPMPEESQNPNLECISSSTSLVPNNPDICSMPCSLFPSVSVDNLPLVPGPTGLPVYITMTGEQILHDMDGRRIPVSSNGYYLPLDPSGRLFAHIVSPGNQAVPIHMTEDGVLRLPNSEPVPCGPSHNFPVNIDGSVIPLGADSRPLFPVPNLPRQPPLHLLSMQRSGAVDDWQGEKTKWNSTVTETGATKDEETPNIEDLTNPQVRSVQTDLLSLIRNLHEKTNKAELLINYQKRALERQQDLVKCKEKEKNLGISPSTGGVKRSIPKKLTQKKASKDEFYDDCDMILDSNDSDSEISSKSASRTKKDNEKYMESNSEDFIVTKVQQVLKSLSERNFKPPAFGRFFISKVVVGDGLTETSLHASPLLRNRLKIPFLLPGANNLHLKNELATVQKSAVTFKFLPEEKSCEKGSKAEKLSKTCNRNFLKNPVFTFDFAMQCDFTSVIIKNLNAKVSGLEMEVVRLRNINANLLDGFRNVQESNEKKSEELRKALLEIEVRNNEILSLKRFISEKGK